MYKSISARVLRRQLTKTNGRCFIVSSRIPPRTDTSAGNNFLCIRSTAGENRNDNYCKKKKTTKTRNNGRQQRWSRIAASLIGKMWVTRSSVDAQLEKKNFKKPLRAARGGISCRVVFYVYNFVETTYDKKKKISFVTQ